MVNRQKLGLLFGTFLGVWHFAWAWLVLERHGAITTRLGFPASFYPPTLHNSAIPSWSGHGTDSSDFVSGLLR